MIEITQDTPPLVTPIKLVFFDIDGTLLNTHGDYSRSLKEQIQRLHHQGIKTAIASGRPSYAAQFLVDEVGIADMGVFCTGAEIFYPKENRHIECHALGNDVVERIYKRAKALGVYCELYGLEQHYVDAMSDIGQIHTEHLRAVPKVLSGDEVLAQSPVITKLLLGQHMNKQPNLKQLEAEFSECEFAFAHFLARPEWEFASVVSAKADKNQAFDRVLEHYGFNANEVMAMGDSQSDMTFIQRAGAGVSMGNAPDAVKAKSNYVTLPADLDGAAYALSRLIA